MMLHKSKRRLRGFQNANVLEARTWCVLMSKATTPKLIIASHSRKKVKRLFFFSWRERVMTKVDHSARWLVQAHSASTWLHFQTKPNQIYEAGGREEVRAVA